MFITLEGIEGSGKTTLIENLADVFRTLNHEVLVTREPGGCALGRESVSYTHLTLPTKRIV